MIAFLCTTALVGGLITLSGCYAPTAAARPRVHHNPVPAVASALAGGSLALVVTAIPSFALLAALAAAGIPGVVRQRKRRQSKMLRAHAWPGILDDVTSAVRAGLNLPEALAQAGTRAPQDLRAAFMAFDAHYRRTGDFTAALDGLRAQVDDKVCEQLVAALAITRQVGGRDLTQVLRSLGTFVRADLQIRGELLARQSWSVNAARMAVAAPWVVLVMLCSRPTTIDAYSTPTGAFILLIVAGLSSVAYALMLRIGRLEEAAQ